jgi:hypothetical protein
MTFIEKHRLAGGRTEHAMMKMSWEGEIYPNGWELEGRALKGRPRRVSDMSKSETHQTSSRPHGPERGRVVRCGRA